ncbi:hypothetical protein AGLY_009321 [Aphis glycines]|uniref:Uncharacterized protein n=1 Tax=Aphis glycines TaxID=307491 RepID=A0A6G0TIN1_APHGL|nr:hypothetical protein AGLY_009321 [Aphis glycines]
MIQTRIFKKSLNLYQAPGVLNLNPMMYHCIRKTIVNEDDLSAYDIISRAKLMENLYLQLIHYLNNNKYLKSFEDKSVSLRCLLLEGKLMENLEFYKHKHFFDFSTTKLLANFRDFDILFISSEGILYSIIKFFWLSDFFLTTLQKKILRKIENFCGLKITQKNHVLITVTYSCDYSLCQRKPPPKFEIEELFRLGYAVHRQKKNTHIIEKSIHSSLRSASKTL